MSKTLDNENYEAQSIYYRTVSQRMNLLMAFMIGIQIFMTTAGVMNPGRFSSTMVAALIVSAWAAGAVVGFVMPVGKSTFNSAQIEPVSKFNKWFLIVGIPAILIAARIDVSLSVFAMVCSPGLGWFFGRAAARRRLECGIAGAENTD